MQNQLKLSETVFIAIMATAMGIAWWLYSLIYDILSPLLKTVGLSGLLEGFWHMGGIFFALI
jgi:ABC-type cobalt transport system, permease component.